MRTGRGPPGGGPHRGGQGRRASRGWRPPPQWACTRQSDCTRTRARGGSAGTVTPQGRARVSEEGSARCGRRAARGRTWALRKNEQGETVSSPKRIRKGICDRERDRSSSSLDAREHQSVSRTANCDRISINGGVGINGEPAKWVGRYPSAAAAIPRARVGRYRHAGPAGALPTISLGLPVRRLSGPRATSLDLSAFSWRG